MAAQAGLELSAQQRERYVRLYEGYEAKAQRLRMRKQQAVSLIRQVRWEGAALRRAAPHSA